MHKNFWLGTQLYMTMIHTESQNYIAYQDWTCTCHQSASREYHCNHSRCTAHPCTQLQQHDKPTNTT